MPGVGVLSKGITFEVATYSGSTLSSYAVIDDLQSIPSLGGEPEKVEVTTLADGVRRYINGIKDFGDLEFGFLFDNSTATSSFRKFKSFEGQPKVSCRITLPDKISNSGHGTRFVFDAQLTAGLDEAGVNDPLTYTVTAGLQSDISVEDPQ